VQNRGGFYDFKAREVDSKHKRRLQKEVNNREKIVYNKKKHSCFVIMLQQWLRVVWQISNNQLSYSYPEYGRSGFLRKILKYLPDYTASYPE